MNLRWTFVTRDDLPSWLIDLLNEDTKRQGLGSAVASNTPQTRLARRHEPPAAHQCLSAHSICSHQR